MSSAKRNRRDFGLKPGKDDGCLLLDVAGIISWQDGALDQNLPLHLSLLAMAHMSGHMWL